jgi:hypothetical protein
MSDSPPPSGIASGLDVRFIPPDRVRIGIIENDRIVNHVDCPVGMVGGIVALLLRNAFEASKHLITPIRAGQDYDGEVVQISTLGLGQNQSPLHQTLVLGIGAAKIGFAIPNDSLAELGRNFLTASANAQHRN